MALENEDEAVTLASIAERAGHPADGIRAWSAPGDGQRFWEAAGPETLVPAAQLVTVSQPVLPPNMVWNGRFRDSWQIFLYLGGAFLTCIIVSLFTRRVSGEKLDRVYAAVHTPVHESEPHDPRPFSLPPGMTPTEPRKLINHPDFEIPMPTLVGMAGFAFFWAWVVGLIAFVYWMVTWGV
jgi:hypothetical protein